MAMAPEATADLEQTGTVLDNADSQDIAPESNGVVGAETDSVEETETDKGSEATFSFDSIDDDTLDRLYKERGREDRVRESERQKTEARLRREAGSKENVKTSVESFLRAAGVDPNELVDGTALKKSEFLYEQAKANAATEIAKQLPEAILGEYKVPVEYRERAVEELENGRMTMYVKHLVEGAVAAKSSDMRLKDVPEGSTLHKDVADMVAERLKAELKAAKFEERTRVEAPTPPRGNASTPLTRESITSMSPSEINARWDEVQAAIRG